MPAEPYIGEIFMGGMNFAPVGYVRCSGQLLPISQYDALFSLLGTTYGGDGQTTFAVPNLNGRIPIAQGTGAGLTNKMLGEMGGVENVTVVTSQMPSHSHAILATGMNAGNTAAPTNAVLANSGTLDNDYYNNPTAPTTVAMHANSIAPAGGSQPHNNLQPYLVLNFFIAVEGIYPTQS